ncbi:phage baseplate assembly protein V [Paraburkholderia caribensis]|uniref:phage baseplate assembly protein V n=1 Tax=Paraburkholderia caribensis TaxID=75105 RepID=UPI0028676974|nr:phage baseplate assembly protein V [Paraburkholderia caribensis]MDR6381838.1 uncharacterized protein involved in type VI secretion and phage assembly [Paraburkholderia caribensis]
MRGIHALANAVRQQASIASNHLSWPTLATISSYDASSHAVKVTVEPVDPGEQPTESNWMPLGAIGIGNGWGFAVGPQIGDQVLVVFEHGDFSSGVIVARIFSVAQQAPAVQSGEVWAVHRTGGYLKLTNDGKVGLNGQVEADITAPTINIQATGNVNVQAGGTASITAQSIQLGAAAQSLLSFVTSAFMSLFNGHTHNETGSVTQAPNQQMGSSHLTSTVKGG